MQKILIILLLTLNLYSDDKVDYNATLHHSWESLKNSVKNIDTDKILKDSSDYIDSVNTQENRDKATALYNSSKEELSALGSNMSCLINKFNVKKAQKVTYEVRITTNTGITSSSTAIALSSRGKLVTAYSNIDSYKSIVVIDSDAKEYNATVGKMSLEDDLAYIYIDVKDIAFITLAKNTELGENIHQLSYDNFLLKGILSQDKPNSVMLNIEATKGASGGGVFNDKNELVAIFLYKDFLDKTSYAIKPSKFSKITQDFIYK